MQHMYKLDQLDHWYCWYVMRNKKGVRDVFTAKLDTPLFNYSSTVIIFGRHRDLLQKICNKMVYDHRMDNGSM